MIRVRRAEDRGRADYGWLDTRHSFSFADYYDPEQMGFRALRVINDDRVVGGAGFPTHPHRNMEILSYVVEGALEHRDSMGHGSVIHPGEMQRMSAGRGVTHSEYNHDPRAPVRFLQIWIQPEEAGGDPSYEQRDYTTERDGRLRLVASRDGREESVRVKQDVSVYASVLRGGEAVEHALEPGRHGWVQMVRGRARVGEVTLEEGDGAAIETPGTLHIEAAPDAELLLFDLG